MADKDSQDTKRSTLTITTAPESASLTAGGNGSTAPDVALGQFVFADSNLSQSHAVSVQLDRGSIHWSGGKTVPDGAADALSAALSATVAHDSTGIGSGSVAWNFSIPNGLVAFLSQGETLTVTYDVTVADGSKGAGARQNGATESVTITIAGANDAPTILAGRTDAAETITARGIDNDSDRQSDSDDLDAVDGRITFADTNLDDTHTVSAAFAGAQSTSSKGIPPATLAALSDALTVNIADDSTGESKGQVTWNFSLPANLAAYLSAGESLTTTYNVAITDNHGASVTQPVTITIDGTNDPPVLDSATAAKLAGSVLGYASGSVTGAETAAGSFGFDDPNLDDSHVVSVTPDHPNDIGTLTARVVQDSTGTGIGGQVAWTFTAGDAALSSLAPGQTRQETFGITVSDGHGGTLEEDVRITLTGGALPPTVTAASGKENSVISLSGDISASEPHHDSLTFTVSGPVGSQAGAGWTLSDNAGAQPVHNADGSYTVTPAELPGLQVTPARWFFGNLPLNVTVSDNGVTSTPSVLDVTVQPIAIPPVLMVQPASGFEDNPLAIGADISATLPAVDHGALTYNISGLPAGWSLNQGTLNTDGSYTETPAQLSGLTVTTASNFVGQQNLVVTATDTELGTGFTSAPQNLTVTLLDSTPVTPGVSATTNALMPLTLALPDHDPDPTDPVTLTLLANPGSSSVGSLGAPQPFTDGYVDGAHLHLNADGSVSFDPSGHFNYLSAGESAVVSLSYAATDSHGLSSNGSLDVTVEGVNFPPVLSGLPASITSINDAALPLTNLGITDPNIDDTETVSLAAANGTFAVNGGVISGEVPAISGAGTGTLTVTGSQFAIQNLIGGADGAQIAYTPDFGFQGNDQITFSAQDNHGGIAGTETSSVGVQFVPVPPVLSLTALSGFEDNPLPLAGHISATLPIFDSGTLSYNISGLPASWTLDQGTLNTDGSYTLTPAQLSAVNLVTAPNFVGQQSLAVTATDNELSGPVTSAPQNLAITILDSTPVTPGVSGTTDAVTPLTLALPAHDPDPADPVTLTLLGNVGSSAIASSGAQQPFTDGYIDGAHLHLNADGSVSFNPSGDFNYLSAGESTVVSLSYSATDSHGLSSTGSLDVTVDGVNSPPVLSGVPAGLTSVNDAAVPLDFNISDQNNDDSETVTLTAGNGAFSVNGTVGLGQIPTVSGVGTGTLTVSGSQFAVENLIGGTDGAQIAYTPNSGFQGNDQITFNAQDNHGGVAGTQTSTVSVQSGPVPPILAVTVASGFEDSPLPLAGYISATLPTGDSGTLSYNISGLPAGWALDQGTLNPDGSYTLTAAQLAAVTLNTTPNFTGQQNLSVTATDNEVSGPFTSAAQNLAITILDSTPVTPDASAVTNAATAISFTLPDSDPNPADPVTIVLFGTSGNLGPASSLSSVAIPTEFTDGYVDGAHLHVNADGSISFDPNGVFNYLSVGESVDVALQYIATDSHGFSSTGNLDITVDGANLPPTISGLPAALISRNGAAVPLHLQLEDPNTDDTETATLSAVTGTFSVNGSISNGATVSGNGTGTLAITGPLGAVQALISGFAGAVIDYTPAAGSSQDTITFTAQDNHGGTAVPETAAVSVVAAPTVTTSSASGFEDDPLALGSHVTGVLGPGENGTLTYNISGMGGVGSLDQGTLNADGSYTLTPAQLAAVHFTAPNFVGQLNLIVTAIDNEAGGPVSSAPQQLSVSFLSSTPVAGDATYVTDPFTPMTLSLPAVDPDPDDPLTLTMFPGSDQYGSASQSSLALDSGALPPPGTLTDQYLAGGHLHENADGTITFTPAGITDVVTLEYSATDSHGLSSVGFVVINVDNPVPPPVVSGLSPVLTTTYGVPVQLTGLSVAGNGSDIETVSLSATGGTFLVTGNPSPAVSGNGTGTLTLTGSSAVVNSLLNGQNGAGISYLPILSSSTITFTTQDLAAATPEIATVNVTGPIAPLLTVSAASGTEDTPLALDGYISATLPPADSGTLSYNISGLPSGWHLDQGTLDPDGSYTLTPGQLAAVNLIPALRFAGQQTLVVTATDSESGQNYVSQAQNLGVTFADVVPVTPNASATTNISTPITISLPDYDSDPNNALTISLEPGSAGSFSSGPSPGPVVDEYVDGAHVHLNADGTISFDPNGNFNTLTAGQSATVSLPYFVTDSNGGQSIGNLSVTVENAALSPPALSGLPATLTSNDQAPVPLTGLSVSDPNGDNTETVTLDAANGTFLISGSLAPGDFPTVSGAGTTTLTMTGPATAVDYLLSGQNGAVIDYLPDAGFSGSDIITFAAQDSGGGAATPMTAAVSVTVPQVHIASVTGAENSPVNIGTAMTIAGSPPPNLVVSILDHSGATLSDSTQSGLSSITVPISDLANLAVTPAAGFTGDIAIGVSGDGIPVVSLIQIGSGATADIDFSQTPTLAEFLSHPSDGNVVLDSFNPLANAIDLSQDGLAANANAASLTASDGHGGSLITIAPQQTIDVSGVTPAALLAAHDIHLG